MTAGALTELEIISISDHGEPNRERVSIYVADHCDLSDYCLLLGHIGVDGTTAPIKDHMLWFGYGTVNPGDWIFVYTASGSTTITPYHPFPADTSIVHRLISVHWGKEHTIFQNPGVVPMLVRVDAAAVMAPPAPQYQGVKDGSKMRLR